MRVILESFELLLSISIFTQILGWQESFPWINIKYFSISFRNYIVGLILIISLTCCKKIEIVNLMALRTRLHRILKRGKSRVVYDLCLKLASTMKIRTDWHFRLVQKSNLILSIVILHYANQLNTAIKTNYFTSDNTSWS